MNLYMPYTNYHILLSLAIAMANSALEHQLILVNPSLKRLCNIFNLKNIHVVSLRYDDRRNNIHSFCIKKHNLHFLANELKCIDSVSDCFYCCEWHVYTTYLIHLIRKMSASSTRFCLIEDGVSTYVEPVRKKKNVMERLGNYILYGSWHKDFYRPGMMVPNCDVYALLPDLLGKNFNNNIKHLINFNYLLENLNEVALSEIVDECNRSYDLNIKALIALDFNSRYTKGEVYRQTMLQLIYEMAQRYSSIAIKRHPADDKSIDFIPVGVNNVFELDAKLPIEFYYLKFRKTLKMVVGSLSTSLLTAHCMLPDIQVLSTISRENIKNEPQAPMIIELFNKLGIETKVI